MPKSVTHVPGIDLIFRWVSISLKCYVTFYIEKYGYYLA